MPSTPANRNDPSATFSHVTDYLRVLYKRRWMAAAAFLAVFLWGAVSSLKTTPVYEATTQLLIERQTGRAMSLDAALEPSVYYDSEFLPTELRILQSRALARRTIEALGVWNENGEETAPSGGGFDPIAGFRMALSNGLALVSQALGAPARIDPPAADETTAESVRISAFLGGLTVEPIRYTRLVALKYRSPDPAFAARAVNAVASQYIQQSIELRFLASQEANEWLAEQLEDQRKQVERSEAALQAFRETYGAVAVDDRQNVVVQRLADLNARVIQARSERTDKEAAYNRLRVLASDQAALESFPAILGNPFIQRLKTEVVELERQQSELSARYGERHPEMVRAAAQLRSAEARLQAEIDNVVEAVRNEFLTAQARERSLAQALETERREALSLNRTGIEYAVLEREAMSNRQLYENLLQRAKESGVSGEFRGSNIQVVDAAEMPMSPVLPRTARDLMMAALLGCLAALGLVFAFERVDNRIRSPEEIRTLLGLPYLGLVPTVPDKETVGESPLLTNGVPPRFSEAIRAIRTAVLFSTPDEGSKAIVVTSAGPGEGKTLVATNLAVALAQAGQRTLVIDGDLRRPRVHDVFGRMQEPGLSNVLVGESTLQRAIHETTIPDLWVMAAGHMPPNPAELLGSKRCGALLESLKSRFDWIVVDAPPVMAVTDAAVLANRAAGVVFVVGAEMTPRPNAVTALEQLAAARAHLIGGVLNRVDVERHSYYYAPYYRKDYTAYYGTGQPADQPTGRPADRPTSRPAEPLTGRPADRLTG